MSSELIRVKELFFDRKAVKDQMDQRSREVLSHWGGFTRTTAKRSMRKLAHPAPPGKPPRVVKGTIKRLTFYSFDPATRSVVVGPVLSSRPTGAPDNLEHGGLVRAHGKHKAYVMTPRPFMQPASDKANERLPDWWAHSLNKVT